MNQDPTQRIEELNRRDFLKGGSLATLMTMLGGVQLFAQTNAVPGEKKYTGPKVKVAVIGLGSWGREILNTLAVVDAAQVAAVCDTYAASVRRASSLAPGAAQSDNYKTLLENKDIKAVIVATPTHQHKDIVLEALQAGKHVYCEAPLATTIEDARAIAAAAKAARTLIFQAGLQLRSDPQRHFLLPFIRSGALGQWVMTRSQYHKKQSWRATSPKPEREKELNWRLNKATSIGLVGEFGIHHLDQATWFMNAQPTAVNGFGALLLWKDGRDVPDTVRTVFEFPGGVTGNYNATLANSFDAEYEMFYGSDAAVMLRDASAWMFKEVDSPLLGWEVYASKQTFYKETGIVLKAGASKSVPGNAPAAEESPYANTSLNSALTNFLRNAGDYIAATEDFKTNFGDDQDGLVETLGKVLRRPAAGYQEAFQATVTAIKANEAVLNNQRVTLAPELYALS